MRTSRLGAFTRLAVCLCALGGADPLSAQKSPGESPGDSDRIVTSEEVKKATHSPALSLLRIFSFPHRRTTAGMEIGLIASEKNKIIERFQLWTDNLRKHGVEYRFGGSGEGAGLGGGGSYTVRTGERGTFRLLGLLTFKGYQEFLTQWTNTLPANQLILEGSYQWRPQENFYGLGHGSLKEKHSNFALRQSWAGLRWEVKPAKRFHWGALYRVAWISALPGRNPAYSSPQVFFSNLPGFGAQTQLHSAGTYLDMDMLRKEYQWGGAAHWGASYQEGLGDRNLRYFSYEMQLEGRMPIVPTSSVLVGQANFELNRQRGGSDPIPFYLLPHIGGSSTLRGFALDRFYGKNLMLLSLEYRYGIHPNIQAIPFFDEGQIFDRTSDLRWLNWHRNYGIGFRFRSTTGTALKIEYGRSMEGFQIHVTFGERERPPLRGPIRYGAYKR